MVMEMVMGCVLMLKFLLSGASIFFSLLLVVGQKGM